MKYTLSEASISEGYILGWRDERQKGLFKFHFAEIRTQSIKAIWLSSRKFLKVTLSECSDKNCINASIYHLAWLARRKFEIKNLKWIILKKYSKRSVKGRQSTISFTNVHFLHKICRYDVSFSYCICKILSMSVTEITNSRYQSKKIRQKDFFFVVYWRNLPRLMALG